MISAASLLALAQWYLATTALSGLVLPLTLTIVPGRRDAAWALARIVALPLVAYLGWIAASLGLVRFGGPALVLALAVTLVLSLGAAARVPRVRRGLRGGFPSEVAVAELTYLGLLLAVAAVRSMRPDLEGLEKFMNFAFINAAYHAETLPLADPWFAGQPLNYYYFGHLETASASLLTGVRPEVGYNLMFAQVFATAGAGLYVLVSRSLRRGGPDAARLAIPAGVMVAFATMLGGNFHALVYGVVRPALTALGLMATRPDYFFPNSSRFVGHDPPTNDKTITEFPGYSVVIGDLHAHVLNLPVAVALLFLITQVLLARRAGWGAVGASAGRARRVQAIAIALALVLLFAVSGMSNTWDVPLYLGVLGLALIGQALGAGQGAVRAVAGAGSVAVCLGLAAILAAWPFWRAFEPFSQGLTLTLYGTPLWQFLVLYGNHAVLILVAIGVFLAGPLPPARRRPLRVGVLLATAALFILAIPEIIAVKDIYGADHQRANTMFKTSYQAYVLLPAGAGILASLALATLSRVGGRFALACVYVLLSLGPMVFLWFAYDQNLRPAPGRWISLNGILFLAEKSPGDYAVREFLTGHRPGPGEAILEASGDSYTYAARISATTGIPTVVGWHVHEWLWRNSPTLWRERADLVARFYGHASEAFRRDLIARFRIRYVVIGAFERERYPDLDEAGLRRLGPAVVDRDGTVLIAVGDAR